MIPAAPAGAGRAAVPALFVLLWSSGYPACKAAVNHAGAFTVLLLRFGGALAILLLLARLARAPWPRARAQWIHLAVTGVLIHAIYLGINFSAAERGFPVGITALIGALQPLLTAAVATLALGERIAPRQWGGLVLGLAGVLMVLSDRIAFDWASPGLAALVVLALASLTAGTLYQKRYCGFMDWRTGMAIQLVLPTLLMLAAALLWPVPFEPHPELIGGVAWLVLMSSGVYALLQRIFRGGDSARAASLFYLVPVVTSTFMYLMFGERLGPLALLGMALTVSGVAAASLVPASRRDPA